MMQEELAVQECNPFLKDFILVFNATTIYLYFFPTQCPPLRKQVTLLQKTHGGLAFEEPFQWTIQWCCH